MSSTRKTLEYPGPAYNLPEAAEAAEAAEDVAATVAVTAAATAVEAAAAASGFGGEVAAAVEAVAAATGAGGTAFGSGATIDYRSIVLVLSQTTSGLDRESRLFVDHAASVLSDEQQRRQAAHR
jgi:hypothetical protein